MSKHIKQEETFKWTELLKAPTSVPASLQGVLKMNLAQAILDGRLVEGTLLPSTRVLASLLGVARVTVVLAYEALHEQGLLVARDRSGHYVAEGVNDRSTVAEPEVPQQRETPVWSSYFSPRAANTAIERQQPAEKYRYPFGSSSVSRKTFPFAEWRECSRLAQSTHGSEHWTSDLADTDDPFLLEQVITRILAKRGIAARPEEVLITMGSQMALYILSEILGHPNSTLAVEEPSRPEVRALFAGREARILPLDVDKSGLVVPEGVPHLSSIYCSPGHQIPTGVVLPLHRRKALLQLAHARQALIIEDYSDADYLFNNRVIPPLRAMDESGRVIHLGSFSHTVPGLRLGYMVAHPSLIRKARQLRWQMMRHIPGNLQRSLALFIAHGHYQRSLHRHRKNFSERANQITAALRQHLPTWRFHAPEGGSTIWLSGPPSADVAAIRASARKQGISIDTGERYFHTIQSSGHLRLNYTSIEPELIQPGIEALAKVIANATKTAPLTTVQLDVTERFTLMNQQL